MRLRKSKARSAERSTKSPRELFEMYASAVAYVEFRDKAGDVHNGSAFHVGEGVFVTARHVVENQTILSVATTEHTSVPDPEGLGSLYGKYRVRQLGPATASAVSEVYCHPDDRVDVAAFVAEGIEAPAIPLGSHLDDWLNDNAFLLRETLVLGYPPIPLSSEPKLVAVRAQVNAVVDKYTPSSHPHFVVSGVPRGGFSGGPCLIEWDFALGVVTESLVRDQAPSELGFMAVLSVEPILVCLGHHRILPKCQSEIWDDGFWDPPSNPESP